MHAFIDILTGAMIAGVAIVIAWVLIKLSHNEKHDEQYKN